MRHQTNITLILTIFFFLIPMVTAVPPFQSEFGTGTLVISTPQRQTITYGLDYTFNVHVYNTSGIIKTNSDTSCRFHLYNDSGKHVIEETMTYDATGKDFYTVLNTTTIQKKGFYDVLINCNNSIGGFFSTTIEFTSDGLPENRYPYYLPIVIAMLGITAIVLFSSFAINNKQLEWLKALLFLYGVTNALALSILPYYITTYAGRVDFIRNASIGYFSVNVVVILAVILFYGLYLIQRSLNNKPRDDYE